MRLDSDDASSVSQRAAQGPSEAALAAAHIERSPCGRRDVPRDVLARRVVVDLLLGQLSHADPRRRASSVAMAPAQ